jgi:hypothetical protein
VAIPDQRRRFLAEAEDEIVDPVAVEVGNDRAGLLSRTAGRRRQLAAPAGKILPDGSGAGGRRLGTEMGIAAE